MPDKQSELCREVLSRMSTAGLLDELVLVGSWCLLAYRDYFAQTGKIRTLRTRDLDFLVPLPSKLRKRVNMGELLEGLGFVMGHRGNEGYAILQHPELLVEFLVPERGKGSETAIDLPLLGMNAQPLRYMDIALTMVMDARLHDVPVRVPHPACFALHKLLVAPRRKDVARRDRDAEMAVHVLELLQSKGESLTLQTVFKHFPRPWRKVVLAELNRLGRNDMDKSFGLSA